MVANLSPYDDYTSLMNLIDGSDLAESTKTQYKKALRNYLVTGAKLGDAQLLGSYARGLNRSSRAFLKSAIRLVSDGYAQALRANATPGNIAEIQASLYRLEAVSAAVQVKAQIGEKAHTWLTQTQVRALMASCGNDLEGKRDWVVLGLMVGAGLRREELVNVRFEDIKSLPRHKKNGNGTVYRKVLEVMGKGARSRLIPISDTLAQKISDWGEIIGNQGLIARSLGRNRVIGESLSTIGVFNICRKHGAMIGTPDLAPHDLRRTYAQLGYEAGVPVTQISKLLGHADIATTQRYLNLDLDLDSTISDFISLE